MTLQVRRTRFVCISDTHNANTFDGHFKLPKGDVLIHAGDLTRQGTLEELRKTLQWIEEADFEVKLVVAGNHDVTLDKVFYADHGPHFHNQYPQNSQACIDMIKSYPSITYLNHEHVNVRLTKEEGPKTGFKVFGSPYSPANGHWAFGYPPDKASEIWDQSIPLDTDIVITHTPPKYHCDESKDRGAAGCEFLRQKLWRIRPSLAICGHVHEGRGAERILWDLETQNVKYKEAATGYWTDPGLNNKKQSIVNLSSKSQLPLRNRGSWAGASAPSTAKIGLAKPNATMMGLSPPWSFQDRSSRDVGSLTNASPRLHAQGPHPAVWGQGGTPPSGRCDLEALADRLDRKETCCVNAAIMASSWPYNSNESRRYNKPIVVDIDLSVWEEEEDGAAPEDCAVTESSLISRDFTASNGSTANSSS